MSLVLEGCTPLLQVFDMPRSVAFYRDVLGFEITMSSQPGEDFGWGLLRRGAIEVMLNTAYDTGERPAAPDPARVTAHDDTALFFACPDLDAAYLHVRAHGIAAASPSLAPYGRRQLWLRDPDGYAICLQEPARARTE
jgi:glyoxylase I family protein